MLMSKCATEHKKIDRKIILLLRMSPRANHLYSPIDEKGYPPEEDRISLTYYILWFALGYV
jgi:hypothetical protein